MHNIKYAVYDEKVNKKNVKKELDNIAMREDWQEGCSGLPNDIVWHEDKAFSCYEDAVEWIEEHDRGFYEQIAVLYHDTSSATSKKIDELKAKLKEESDSLWNMKTEKYAKTITSEYTSCKCCGSKLSVKHLKYNNCPLCNTDLRPQTTLNKIEMKEKRVSELKRKLAEEQKKFVNKTPLKWLVKYEYHT